MSDTSKSMSVTLKAHGGHDATWVVIYADTVEEMAVNLDAFSSSGVSSLIGAAVTSLRAQEALGAQLGARPVDSGPPPAAPAGSAPPPASAPAGNAPTCPHGVKVYLEKAYKNKPGNWRAWACPAPQGTNGACGLEFIR